MIDRHLPKRVRPAWRVIRRTASNYLDEEGLQWSGAVAFYLVLSVPPLLIAAVSIGVALIGADGHHHPGPLELAPHEAGRLDLVPHDVDRRDEAGEDA